MSISQDLDSEKEDFDCQKDGIFPDPNSTCRYFFKCKGKQSWRFKCPPNTKIDATLGFCNHEGYINENCNDTSFTSNNKKTISTTTGAIKQPLTSTRRTGQPPSTREASIQPLQIWGTTTTTTTTT